MEPEPERMIQLAPPPAPPPLTGAAKTLDDAEKLYSARDLEKAKETYLAVLQQTDEKKMHAAAFYGLARIAALQKDPESSQRLFLKALEEARTDKLIGSGLEAKVVLTVDENMFAFLQKFSGELRYIFIVSQVELVQGETLKVEVKKADGAKCERCWNYSVHVGESEKYPTACERCVEALTEIQKAAGV